jgi:lipoprotein-anchoring transpeptidase ErfK/SrfK
VLRTVLLLAVLTPLASATTASAAPRDATAPPRIAADVTAGGVAVGGLTEAEATAKIQAELGPRMLLPVVVRVGGHAYKLSHGTGKFVLDAGRMARGALKIPALADGVTATGGAAAATDRSVGLSIDHSRAAVKRFAAGVADKEYLAPRSATLQMTTTKMRLTRQRGGHRIDAAATAKLIDTALSSVTATRGLRVRTAWLEPATSTTDLRNANPKVITVDRDTFTLRLFTKLSFTKRYGVAVGMSGLSTPAGVYHITDKQVDPAWHVPMSAWAGSLAGTTVPGGAPDNPLKARWMGLVDGVGIHGTSEDWSIGSAASHGCIRMHVSDVKDLYARVSVGTPVLIK